MIIEVFRKLSSRPAAAAGACLLAASSADARMQDVWTEFLQH